VNLLGVLLLLVLVVLIIGTIGTLHVGPCATGQSGICITFTN